MLFSVAQAFSFLFITFENDLKITGSVVLSVSLIVRYPSNAEKKLSLDHDISVSHIGKTPLVSHRQSTTFINLDDDVHHGSR